MIDDTKEPETSTGLVKGGGGNLVMTLPNIKKKVKVPELFLSCSRKSSNTLTFLVNIY